MDLRGNQITIGEILQNPQAKEMLKQEFPVLFTPQILLMARGMTLSSVLRLAGSIPTERIQRILTELESF